MSFAIATGVCGFAPFAISFATGLSRVKLLSILLDTFAVTSLPSATSGSEIVTTPAGVTDTLSDGLPFTVQLFPDFATVTVSGVVLPVGVYVRVIVSISCGVVLLGRVGGVIVTVPFSLATTLGAVGVTAKTTGRLISTGANVFLVVLLTSETLLGNIAVAFRVYFPALSNVVPGSNLSPCFHVHVIPLGK